LPPDWSDSVLPYLYLYPQRLHIPEAYGLCQVTDGSEPVLLLENAPLDGTGHLYPAIAQAWAQSTAVRQVYWLWQLLQLWVPLQEQGVATSLLAANNIRVEGWRVRLCQLYLDEQVLPAPESESVPALRLADLANLWLGWLEQAHPTLRAPLAALCQQMQSSATLSTIAAQLNALLLEQAAALPLHLEIAGATDTGPERSHNEDTCYPLAANPAASDEPLPYLGMVCDGIGGHEGGEVASQMAVRTLKLQAQALLTEVAQQPEPVLPDLLAHQLEASIRIANNLIAHQNDAQERVDRRRMGTTLVLALQVPQPVRLIDDRLAPNAHELYLVNVGDSRAYWITPHYCHLLTVDDDVAAREVRMGRAFYREALLRPDAGALTQALGTRDAEFLRPIVQRFMLEEDGLLLLCSDGLSDHNLVEQFWFELADPVFQGTQSLPAAAQAWVDLANQKNGHDNTSVVLLQCRVSATAAAPTLPPTSEPGTSDWSPASQALIEETSAPTPAVIRRRSLHKRLFMGLLALFLLGGIGLVAWRVFYPNGFQQFQQRNPPRPS
jgi:protein phosphatase